LRYWDSSALIPLLVEEPRSDALAESWTEIEPT
jgi:predicted nucleic acid-binding protein